jgi:hypothetical protein
VTLTSLTRAAALPSAEDFVVIEEFLICFECIENVTEEISGWEKFVTESLIIPVIRGIHLKLNDIETKRLMNTDVGKLMFQTLKTSVIQRLNRFETRKSAMLATLLDPRIKKHGFRCQENASNANTELLHELNNLIRNEVQVSCDIAKEEPVTKNESNFLLDFLDDVKTVQTSMPTTSSAIIEMRQYRLFDKKRLNP